MKTSELNCTSRYIQLIEQLRINRYAHLIYPPEPKFKDMVHGLSHTRTFISGLRLARGSSVGGIMTLSTHIRVYLFHNSLVRCPRKAGYLLRIIDFTIGDLTRGGPHAHSTGTPHPTFSSSVRFLFFHCVSIAYAIYITLFFHRTQTVQHTGR